MNAKSATQANNRMLTRRGFMRRAGLGAAAAAGALLAAERQAAASDAPSLSPATEDETVGVLIDLTRCSGCQSCALACKEANRMPQPELIPARLGADALTVVETRVADGGEEVFVKRQCMNCVHPACASACTVGALRKAANGAVVYDSSKCIGCRYCQYACPFGVPAYEWNDAFGLIAKCQLCAGRLNAGREPACAAACPNGAIRFGKRHELLAQAHAQIASAPARYIDHVYGEHEAGGTQMLYLSAVPFGELGFPVLGDAPVPHYAETVMQLTPAVALTVASVATGLHLLLRRRHPPVTFAMDAGATEGEARAHAASAGHEEP